MAMKAATSKAVATTGSDAGLAEKIRASLPMIVAASQQRRPANAPRTLIEKKTPANPSD